MSLLKLLFAFITISLASLAPAIEIDDDYEPKIKQMIETDREAYVMLYTAYILPEASLISQFNVVMLIGVEHVSASSRTINNLHHLCKSKIQ